MSKRSDDFDFIFDDLRKVLSDVRRAAKTYVDEQIDSGRGFSSEALMSALAPGFSTALHEAGHVVTAWCSSHILTIERVEIHTFGIHGGMTEYAQSGNPQSQAYQWSQLSIKLGGIAGELSVNKKFSGKTAEQDLMRAKEGVQALFATRLPSYAPWSRYQEGTAPDFARVFQPSIPPHSVRVLRGAYLRAKQQIERHRKFFSAVAIHLYKKRRLDMQDLESLAKVPRAFTLLRERAFGD